tara:strand:- start:785 stop:1051 length:267 start_codon:yes stop_codon:yes gene_type:complete
MPAKKKTVEPTEVIVKYCKTQALYKALHSRYEADKQEALATLTTYFECAAGIGEHPQVVQEMNGQVNKLSEAEGNMESLNKWFSEYKP